MKFLAFVLLLTSFCVLVRAQDVPVKAQPVPRPPVTGKNDTIKTYLTNYEGQLIPWTVTPEIKITDTRIFESEADRQAYYRLRYNVIKVWPYAKFAAQKYEQLQRDLATTGDKNKQKELRKACEDQVKEVFNKEIKNLTITQGEVLIKLVARETGNTSYTLAKDMQGGFHAFMYQSVARIFGHNLKQDYDPREEHDIESILFREGLTTNLY